MEVMILILHKRRFLRLINGEIESNFLNVIMVRNVLKGGGERCERC